MHSWIIVLAVALQGFSVDVEIGGGWFDGDFVEKCGAFSDLAPLFHHFLSSSQFHLCLSCHGFGVRGDHRSVKLFLGLSELPLGLFGSLLLQTIGIILR